MEIIATITISITIISGVVMHFTDQKTYPNVGDGLWWAIQTITTVGYGDLRAHQHARDALSPHS